MSKRAASVASWAMWIVMGFLVLVPTVFFALHLGDCAFVSGTMGNWFATVVGVAAGIPIALWLARWQQQQQDAAKVDTQQKLAESRRRRILRLVRKELEANRDNLARPRVDEEREGSEKVYSRGLRTALWNALSDGGELQWIEDLDLLAAISLAYHYISRVDWLDTYGANHILYPGKPSRHASVKLRDLLDLLSEVDREALKSVEAALAEIDRRLSDSVMV